MNEKTEALRLADALEMSSIFRVRLQAAAELRRLHAENESLRQIVRDFPPVEAELREVSDRAHRLEAQRDALLEALDQCLNGTLIGGHTHNDNGLEVLAERCGSPHVAAELRRLAGIARAAIKAVEETK